MQGTTQFVEVEDEEGNTELGIVERMTEKGEVIVRIVATDKILVFKSDFLQGKV